MYWPVHISTFVLLPLPTSHSHLDYVLSSAACSIPERLHTHLISRWEHESEVALRSSLHLYQYTLVQPPWVETHQLQIILIQLNPLHDIHLQ